MLKYLLYMGITMLSLVINSAAAQDPEFTQFYANPLYLNPAFAGTARCPRFVLNNRIQWPAIMGTYITNSISYDQHIDAISGGLGILFTHDRAGMATLTTTNISGIYSYQFAITRKFSIRIGFQGTYYEKYVDWSKLSFGDQIDPRKGFILNTHEQQNLTKKGNADLSTGILAFSKQFFFGFAANHLTTPDEGFLEITDSPLPMKYTAHAGALLPLGNKEEVNISPNILFQKQQDFRQLNLGLYLMKGPLTGGLWYRQGFQNPDSFIALIGVQQNLLKIGYSYDMTISKLSPVTAGSHELSLQLQFECKPKKRNFRTISCPSF